MGLKDYAYENYPLRKIHEMEELINLHHDLFGLNVTIPYKESIIPFLDDLDQEARNIGAVNTVRILRKNERVHTIGYNTDVYGFHMSLKPFLLNTHHRALVLGTGGAAKAVKYVLKKMGISVVSVSRYAGKAELTYDQLNEAIIRSHPLIINTTPLGMHPDSDSFPPIPYQAIGPDHLLFDLIYNPEETLFLKKGKEQGAVILNGHTMLKLQAEKAWEIWHI